MKTRFHMHHQPVSGPDGLGRIASLDGGEPELAAAMTGVGAQIRSLRKAKGMTLEYLAARSGVSTGLLSQLERGQGNPSFNSLVRIAHALGTPVAQLMHAETDRSPVVRRDERRNLHVPASADGAAAATHELLTPRLDQLLEAVWVEAPVGYSTEATPFSHAGEEFGIVLSGQHEVHVGDACYVLEAGDSISYPSTLPHWYRNPGPEPVTAIWIITPPTF
jgi:transcriptional regulator with XRE-family HTH domain